MKTALWMTFCAACIYLAAWSAWGQSIDPAATEAAVCAPGYAAAHRPPLAWSEDAKRRMLLPGHRMAEFQLDHVVPLELAGAPRDPKNLQLQPWPEARLKDRAENRLHALVCSGRMTLRAAQGVFATPDGWRGYAR